MNIFNVHAQKARAASWNDELGNCQTWYCDGPSES
jgi:hypothetical protein